MGCTISEWQATATGQADERVITVIGEGECTSSGHVLRLEPTNEGIVDDPDTVALRLVVENPEVGAEVITPVHVETEIHGDPATCVRIDTPSGSEGVSDPAVCVRRLAGVAL